MLYTQEASKLVVKGDLPAGSVTWQSPSNIALIKYWGKHGDQLPNNPSLSLTLKNAYTQATLKYVPRDTPTGGVAMSFLFDGQSMPTFKERIEQYLNRLIPIFPFIEQYQLDIRSRNSFPHSSGIASSASAMSALALCLCSMEHELFNTLEGNNSFRRKASHVARLGSGSACRSIYSKAALWGKTGLVENSADEYAVPMGESIHNTLDDFRDAILIISSRPKATSSSLGHQMMDTHPFAAARYEAARKNLLHLIEALRKGDLDHMAMICEHEALSLHALLISSQPAILLLQPNTIKVIQLVREFRRTTGNPVFFSIDAGPNLHLLYPGSAAEEVENFITGVLAEYCEEGAWINDGVGPGPVQL
ncbi:MAG: diphosphomevalonate decarboxylase [Saprospiraceae bacterium]|nr:diphosphomevalonate decarboxylase [Saprospiraceae bacterium]